jgi:hypothetical protein
LLGELGGKVIGVRVGGDDRRAGFVEALEVGNDAAEGFEGLVGFQVADMLAEEDLRANGEGNGVLQVGPDG